MHFDIKEGLRENILNFVGPWLQLSTFEDRRGVVGQGEGHG